MNLKIKIMNLKINESEQVKQYTMLSELEKLQKERF